jgi:hypothetical protein
MVRFLINRLINTKPKAVPLHAMEALGGEVVQLLLILDLGTRWGAWSASRPGRALAPRKEHPVPLFRRLGGPQSRSGHRLEKKSFCLCRGTNPDRRVLRHYSD